MTDLLLKRATASPGEVYNVMCEERIVGRIMLSADAQFPWVWTLTYGYHEDRTPTHGYEPTREAAMHPEGFAMTAGVLVPLDIELIEDAIADTPQLLRNRREELIDDRRFAEAI